MLMTTKHVFMEIREFIYQLQKDKTVDMVQFHAGMLNGIINFASDADIISLNTWLLLYSLICKVQNEKIKEIS